MPLNNGNDLKCKSCTLNCTLNETEILEYLKNNPFATQKKVAEAVNKSLRTVKTNISSLQEKGLLIREGAKKSGKWIVR
jgi:ATP-dependent DNA helicase RecG